MCQLILRTVDNLIYPLLFGVIFNKYRTHRKPHSISAHIINLNLHFKDIHIFTPYATFNACKIAVLEHLI